MVLKPGRPGALPPVRGADLQEVCCFGPSLGPSGHPLHEGGAALTGSCAAGSRFEGAATASKDQNQNQDARLPVLPCDLASGNNRAGQ